MAYESKGVSTLPNGVLDTFSKVGISKYFNQIDIQFYRDVVGNLLTLTTANSGSAGLTNGLAQFASSTQSTGSSKAVTFDSITYKSGSEIYSLFTSAWLDGGTASSYQRIGLYDTNNGFFIGYEGPTFGVTVRKDAVDTQTPKASWNVDTLVGGDSKFTRSGVVEAIDLTKLNIFRIRFGWLGSAPIKFEVVSPDGDWIKFHDIKQPNLSSIPSVSTADLPMTLDITKTSGATNIRMNTACWGAGINHSNFDASGSGSLGTAINSTVYMNTGGISIIIARIGTSTTGTLAIESSYDGVTWVQSPNIIKISPTIGNSSIIGSFTASAGDIYRIPGVSIKGVRVRTVTTLGATVSIFYNLDESPGIFDINAQIRQRNPTYRIFLPPQTSGTSSTFPSATNFGKNYFDVFNASGSNKRIRLLSCIPIVSGSVANTTVLGLDLYLFKTNAVGTGGSVALLNGTGLTAMSFAKMDSSNPDLPSQISGRLAPTLAATSSIVSWCSVFTEETTVSTYLSQTNDFVRRNQMGQQSLSFSEGEGFKIVNGPISAVGLIGFDVIFELE